MNSAKQEIERLLEKLPENCSLEDIQYHLYVMDKVQQGLEDVEKNGGVSQTEAKKPPEKVAIATA